MFFTEEKIAEIAAGHYGISGSVNALNGYDELNFVISTSDGKMFICKVANDKHGLFFLDAQVEMLQYLAVSIVSDGFSQYLKNNSGNQITTINVDDANYYLRILTFLEGTFWVEVPTYPDELFYSLGSFLGAMDKALQHYSHPALHRHYEWDIANTMDVESNLSYILDHEKRRIASYFVMQFREEVIPIMPKLRKAYIHSDANDYNVLVNGNKVTGLIDFGDIVYSELVNNLAIACTYAMFNQQDVIKAASLVIKGYHEQYPLTEKELSVMYYLIAGRLCISVTHSAYQAAHDSENEHHFITENNAWDLLFKLIGINPLRAHNDFRIACGMSSVFGIDLELQHLESRRNEHISRNLSIGYDNHLKIIKGALQYLYDDRGNTFVDCVNNVSHVGHCHPTVVNAMKKQISTLNTNTRYLHDNLVEYAEKLTATLPSKLKVCFFTNSGSEANDLAIRISRHFTQKKDIIVLDHAYHGTSTVAMEMSPYKFDGKGGSGKKPFIHKAINPDLYRGEYRYSDSSAGVKYAGDVQRIIQDLKDKNTSIAAFICETLLGVGGQIPLPPGYLKEVYRYVREAGGICIADEVQVGFGRVGSKFWGFELQDVEPDIVVLGKPIGNGHPLAAVVITQELADAFNNGMEYFNTFGGNPVSMAAGLAVLKVIEEEELQQNAFITGNYLLEKLLMLKSKHRMIGDVRGAGLFVGVELVRDHYALEPAVPEIDSIVEKMKDLGFLLSTDGPLHNVLKIKPPLVFSKRNADDLVGKLDQVLKIQNP